MWGIMVRIPEEIGIFLDSVNELIGILDQDLNIIYINKVAAETFGLKRHDMVGQNLLNILPGARGSVFTGVLREAIRADAKSLQWKTTDCRILEIDVYPSANGITMFGRDITEHKKAEEGLRRSEIWKATSLYTRNLIEASLDPLVTISADGKITDVNNATELVTGYSREELIGSDFSDYFTEPKKAREGYKQVFTEGFVKDYPLSIMDKSGRRTDVLYNATVYRNEAGEIQGVFAAARDVTEHRKAEAQIRGQADLLDKANDAIIALDLQGNITFWNKGAEKIYGWAGEEAVGKKIRDLLRSNPPIVALATEKLMATGQWGGELKHTTKDGKKIIVESHWTLVSDESQKPVSIMEINTDVTERKNLETRYLRAQRLESLGTLAGGVAHDFRNILTPVMIGLSSIDKNLTKKEYHDMVSALLKNLQRGADLTKQLLTFTRGAEGDRTPISVFSLISDVERTIKETFPRSIKIETKIDPYVPSIMGNNTLLHQVLINMSINARDAMPFGGTLSITAENAFIDHFYAKMHPDAKVGSYAMISVIDSGVGMTPEMLDRLFEPFFTTKKPGEGTGLGLSTAGSIVKSHGGFITVYSEVGKGTAFKIYLPIWEVKSSVQKEPVIDESLRGNGQTILVVDDEELIRITTLAALGNNGYKALGAADGADALALYMRNVDCIKVVLLDMSMPVMDGVATTRALGRISPDIKIIGMSGLAENGKYKSMYNATKAFITKPFTAEQLLKTIAKVVNEK